MVKNVRMRDEECIVTGTHFIKRERGDDWTGLEVAHIYPYTFAEKVCLERNIASLFSDKKQGQ